jgi:hypothetical protein
VLPTTEAITLLRHPSDVVITHFSSGDSTNSAAGGGGGGGGGVVTVDVATPWLRDVSLVDTPGTNTLDPRHTALTNEFLPRADLLLFVTSAERPFSESEQTFLRAIRSWGKKVVFVVNKADLLADAAEVMQVTEYVSLHGTRELGSHVPVFPVAAKAALRLKGRAGGVGGAAGVPLGTQLGPHARDDAECLAATQWAALEAHILRVIGSDARAAAKIGSQISLAAAVLGTYERRQEKLAAFVAADDEAVGEARRRLDAWESDMLKELEAHRARVLLVMHALRQRGHDFLEDELQLSMLPRLLSKDDFVQRFHQAVLADAGDELQQVVTSVAAWMDAKGAAQVRATCELLSAKLMHRLESSESAKRGESTMWAAAANSCLATSGSVSAFASDERQRQLLVLQLKQSASKTISNFDPSSAAQRMVTAAQTSLAQAALLEAGAAGLSGLVAVKAAALVDLTGLLPAALLAATGLGLLPYQRYRLQTEYRERVDELSAVLDRAVHAHLTQELYSAKDRAAELVKPFAALAGSAGVTCQEQQRALAVSRAAVDALAAELSRIATTDERG